MSPELPARVKRRGKSSPLHWRQWGHGKPHQEQDQIGGRFSPAVGTDFKSVPTAGLMQAARPSSRVRSLKVSSNRDLREMIITPLRETSKGDRIRLIFYLVRFVI